MTGAEAVADVVELVAADPAAAFADLQQAHDELAELWREQERTAAPRSSVGENLLAVIDQMESSGLVLGSVDRSRLP